MHPLISILLLFCVVLPLAGQAPGGVPGPTYWRKPATLITDKATVAKEQYWNGWPTLSAVHEERVMLPQKPVTLFTVFRPQDASVEETVYSITQRHTPAFILTNRRLANLQDTTYLNLPIDFWRKPRITTWMHSFADQGAARVSLLTCNRADLPVTSGQGDIAEVVLYPRFLSATEQARVHTYLALKYGVALARGQDYLSATGEVLWSGRRDSAYAHRITGIGRAEATNWYQGQSRFQTAEATLHLGIQPLQQPNGQPDPRLPNNSYLLWGDNDAPWTWEIDSFSAPHAILRRQWMVRSHQFPDTLTTYLRFTEPGRWSAFPPGTMITLEVDRTGTGTFPSEQTDAYQAQVNAVTGQLNFAGIPWDTDGSGSDRVRLSAPAAVVPQRLDGDLSVYPNPVPVATPLQVSWQMTDRPSQPIILQVIDVHGRILKEFQYAPARFVRQPVVLPQAGVYWLVCRIGRREQSTKIVAQ